MVQALPFHFPPFICCVCIAGCALTWNHHIPEAAQIPSLTNTCCEQKIELNSAEKKNTREIRWHERSIKYACYSCGSQMKMKNDRYLASPLPSLSFKSHEHKMNEWSISRVERVHEKKKGMKARLVVADKVVNNIKWTQNLIYTHAIEHHCRWQRSVHCE